VIQVRNINYAIKNAMLVGMVLALSSTPALASGAHKADIEKAKAEINKVEKTKAEKAMPEEKKIDEQMVMKPKADWHSSGLLGEGILGEEDILGEGLLGIEE
jgi:hypothetical protein